MQAAATAVDVVICADDYAMTPGICSGIIALAEQGRISATSAMTLSPHWPAWAQQVRALQERIDVGLHLDWTSDFALALGFGQPLGRLMLHSLLGRLRRAQIAPWIHRQLDLFESEAGTRPDHIDGHQHVHQFPGIREALVEILVARYAAHERPWLRVSHVPAAPWQLKSQIINAMGARALRTLAERHGIAHSRHLSGVYDFTGDSASYRRQLQHWLQQLPPSTVLMCHPGETLEPGAPFAQARLWEQAVLGDPALEAWLASQPVRIVRGSALFGPAPAPAL